MRCERGRLIHGSRVLRTPEATTTTVRAASVPAGSAPSPHRRRGSPKEPQVEPAHMDEQPLQDVGVAPHVGTAHAAGLVEMRVRRRPSAGIWPAGSQSQPGRSAGR